MDIQTIDEVSYILKKYLRVRESYKYHSLQNLIACWQGNINNDDRRKEYLKVVSDKEKLEIQYKRLNVFLDELVRQAKEAAE